MKALITLSLLLSVLRVHCHHVPGQPKDSEGHGDKMIFEHPHPSVEEEQGQNLTYAHEIAPSNANFAFRFHKQIALGEAAKNIFFSPVSISSIFAALTLGAKSETQSQIYKGLAFNLSETEEHKIHKGFHQLISALNDPNNKALINTGNALFIDEPLKILPKFLEDVKTLYGAEAFSSNFQNSSGAKTQINDYVQAKTHGKIPHAVDELDPTTVMVLLNYIFFKAHWKYPFNTHFTKEEDFFVDANTTVKVNLMYRNGYYNFLHDDELSCSVVEIPYKGDASAWFILPDEGKMKQVEDGLSMEFLDRCKRSFIYEEMHLYLPKISISGSYDVKDTLQRMGVTDVFSEKNADLSGITSEPDLYVSKAIHKAVVDIHEGGTEAAGVTVIELSPRFGGLAPNPIFKINRPYLLLIMEKKTHSALFLGKIVNPTEK
ncbi:alpha-1-antitrypsin-like [Podarcis muralis]